MPSHAERTGSDTLSRKAVWLLVAVALNTLELFIPRIPFLPWLKPGLANSITIIWIIRFGTADALFYTLLRVWISSFYFGFSLITVSLSLSGGLLSTLAMGCTWTLLGKKSWIGTVGLAVTGALVHNIGQLVAVYFVLTRNSIIFYQLPLMGIAALLFGSFIGVVTPGLQRVLTSSSHRLETDPSRLFPNHQVKSTPMRIISITVLLTGAAALFAIKSLVILALIALSVTLICFFSSRDATTLTYPVRFWFLFLFIAGINLFFSYGTRIQALPFLTREGIDETLAQVFRLWTWLETSLILNRLDCNRILFSLLKKLFPHRAETLLSGLIALEHFADVLDFVKGKDARRAIEWKKPSRALGEFTARVQHFIYMKTGCSQTEVYTRTT